MADKIKEGNGAEEIKEGNEAGEEGIIIKEGYEKVGAIYDEYFLEHKPFYSHPEQPSRLLACVETLKRHGIWRKLKHIKIEVDTDEIREILEKIHSKEHIEMVESLSGHYGNIDADTYYSPETPSVAMKAVGASIQAVKAIFEGEVKKVFVFERPPGHHATFREAMGFCIYNNAAAAAEKARELGAERVLIVDFDVHHGNGTQDIFWKRDDVLYFSTHRYPFYPGTGRFEEIGEGKGKGFTVNVPLPRGLSDGEYAKIYEEVLLQVAEKFEPEFVVVSAGFDAHYSDPLADMNLTEEGFAYISQVIIKSAPKSKGFVFILEGGYNLEGLSESVRNVILTLMGVKEPQKGKLITNIDEILFKAKRQFSMWLT